MTIKKYYKLIRVSHDDSQYLHIKNVSNETGTFKVMNMYGAATKNLEYSLNGVDWSTYSYSPSYQEIEVAAGSNIYLRGSNSYWNTYGNEFLYFSFNKACEAHGNVCSLLNPTTFQNVTTLEAGCFNGLFYQMTTLTTAPNIGNVTTLRDRVFKNTFQGCSNLTAGIDLSGVTTVGSFVCTGMYQSCSKLAEATTPNVQDLTVNNVLDSWLSYAGGSVSGTKTVKVPTGATISTGSNSGIPTGWTRVDY